MARINPMKYTTGFFPGMAQYEPADLGLGYLKKTADEINDALLKVTDARVLSSAVKERTTKALSNARASLNTVKARQESARTLVREAVTKRVPEFDREVRDFVRASQSPVSSIRALIAEADPGVIGAIMRCPSPAMLGVKLSDWPNLYLYAATVLAPEALANEQQAERAAAKLEEAITVFNQEAARVTRAIDTSDAAIVESLTRKKDAA